jgi:hypothetical protein
MRLRLRLAVLLIFVLPTPARAQDPAPQPENRWSALPVGETLVYEVKFGLLTLGEGLMHIAGIDTVRGDPALHVVFRLRGGTFFYRLDDRMDSWIRLEDFASLRFVQDMKEANNIRFTEYNIFPDSGYYTESGVDSVRASSPNPLDDTAFFYFVRTVPLEDGERYEFDRYFRPDRNPVVLEVLERDTLDVPAGEIPTVLVRPTIQGRGIFEEAKEPQMWLSDDDRRLVVQMKVKFSFATITLRLREIHDTLPEKIDLEPATTP